MPRVNWQPEISLGNLVSVATTIVVLTAGWTALQSDVKAQTSRIDKLEARLLDNENADRGRDVAVAGDRLRQTEILAEMRADLRYLRAAVEASQRQQSKP